MKRRRNPNKPCLFVIDTNVYMHDPTAMYRFQEHSIFVPTVVLEELDRNKKGGDEHHRNARQAIRLFGALVENAEKDDIEAGLHIKGLLSGDEDSESVSGGRLFFQTESLKFSLPSSLPVSAPDNTILGTARALQEARPDHNVIIVSKDINLQIKAKTLGMLVEDYSNDKVLDDASLLHTGVVALPEDFWDMHDQKLDSWKEDGHTFYRITGPDVARWYPNLCIFHGEENAFEAIVRQKPSSDEAVIELVNDYRPERRNIWGIKALNREQNFALNMLLDDSLDFVTLLGPAGTGKTLLTLAAGLTQVLDRNIYREIIVTRATVSMGEEIGFLPGTEEEKMTPWMGALMDNLEVLNQGEGGDWGRAATGDLLRKRIRIQSMNFMRGRTFLKKYIILDEGQNLTPKQMKALISRAGPGTKIVCMGNISQIDTPYLSETTSGLTYAVERFKGWGHGGHITLVRGERSRLADYANENL